MEQPLSFPFTKSGFTHVLVERAGDVALVERTNRQTGSVHYEVVLIQHEPAKRGRTAGVCLRGGSYPGTSSWGIAGWTYVTLPEARAKYAALTSRMPVSAAGLHRTALPGGKDDLGPSEAA